MNLTDALAHAPLNIFSRHFGSIGTNGRGYHFTAIHGRREACLLYATPRLKITFKLSKVIKHFPFSFQPSSRIIPRLDEVRVVHDDTDQHVCIYRNCLLLLANSCISFFISLCTLNSRKYSLVFGI